jgi:hypothetical protein
VVQEPVYQNFLDRYNLNGMTYHSEHTTVFAIYDLSPDADKCNLFQTRIKSSTVEDLFKAFRNNPNIPSRATFFKKLETKLNAKMELKLELSKI